MRAFIISSIVLILLSVSVFGQNTVANWGGDLFWDPSPDGIVGYNIYKGGDGGPYTKVNLVMIPPLTFTFNDALGTADDCYVATAVGNNGMESVFSNQMCIRAPRPPLFLRVLQTIADFLKRIFIWWA